MPPSPLKNSHSFSLSYMYRPSRGYQSRPAPSGRSSHRYPLTPPLWARVASRVGETTLLRFTPSLLASLPLAVGALSLPDPAGGLARGPP